MPENSRIDSNDDDQKVQNPLPAHMMVTGGSSSSSRVSRKRGWAGDEMEMKHRMQQLSSTDSNQLAATAVDLSQFRNVEVGKGYQAKGVVRQRTFETSGMEQKLKVIDMSKKAVSSDNDNINGDETNGKNNKQSSSGKRSSHDKRKSRKQQRKREKDRDVYCQEEGINKYLRNENLRKFRKEIEKIFVEAAKAHANKYNQSKSA
jgi:hypothetical protein